MRSLGTNDCTVTSKHFVLAYNGLDQKTKLTRYQSTGTTNAVGTTDWSFDTDNRLSAIAHKQGTTNLNTYGYTYDAMSRFTQITSTAEGTDNFTYDAVSEVTAATHTSQTNESYSYDVNGNRNSTGYTTGTNNQTTAGQGFTYTYDDEGNRTLRTETSTGKQQIYEWDHRNRLTRVTEKPNSSAPINKEVLYYYDHLNRLVKRTLDADGAGSGVATSQYWAYDDGINALVQYEGASASTLSHRYLWSDQVDEVLSDEQVSSLSSGGNPLYAMSDHLGSVRDIADYNEGTGVTAIANHRTFNAYGKLISETNSAIDLLYAFTGKQLDEATNLQHNLNRWYDSGLGRWISEDRIGFSAGDANLSRYVENAIVIYKDLNGEDETSLLQGEGGIPHGNSTYELFLITDETNNTVEKLKVKTTFSQVFDFNLVGVSNDLESVFLIPGGSTTKNELQLHIADVFNYKMSTEFNNTMFESKYDHTFYVNLVMPEYLPVTVGYEFNRKSLADDKHYYSGKIEFGLPYKPFKLYWEYDGSRPFGSDTNRKQGIGGTFSIDF